MGSIPIVSSSSPSSENGWGGEQAREKKVEKRGKKRTPGNGKREEKKMIELACLFAFSGLALRSGGLVLLTSNPVHSVLFLVLAFMNASGLMLLLEAEFRALLFIVVYVGAIAVLFLFVVMMLNLQMPMGTSLIKSWNGLGRRGRRIGFVERRRLRTLTGSQEQAYQGAWERKASGLEPLVGEGARSSYVRWIDLMDPRTNLETLGQVLYTEYALYVVLAGFVLLVAMVGAIVLTLKERHFAVAKRQQAHQQISRDASRSIMRVRNVR
jgi:NADH-quinone oxidoreductase subunit J